MDPINSSLDSRSGQKVILIIAGPNGAGKTTFATQFLPNEGNFPTFINADLIAAGLNPFQPERAALEAGRMMLRTMDRCVEQGESFALETTLSGRVYRRLIPEWQAQGYRVILLFLSLPTPEVALARVRHRVRQGGHDVPEQVIRRRYHAGWRNFQQAYRQMSDRWMLYDASGGDPVLVAEKDNEMSSTGRKRAGMTGEEYVAFRAGVDAAIRRAAVEARRRAIETLGLVPTWRNGEIAYDTEV